MVLWQEAKGIQQNKTELCSYPAFHAHTEVTQDAIREMLKSVKNPEEMNTNVSVGSQGLFHLFDLKAWLEMCVLSSEYPALEYSKAPSVLFPADSE